MNLLSRTYLAITRRPFKSILLFLIVFILGNLIIGSFITNRSIDSLEIAFKEKVGAVATIKSNIQSPTDENYLGDQQKINAVHDDLVRILEEIRSLDSNLIRDSVDSHYGYSKYNSEALEEFRKLGIIK